jgi:hypothetical protein
MALDQEGKRRLGLRAIGDQEPFEKLRIGDIPDHPEIENGLEVPQQNPVRGLARHCDKLPFHASHDTAGDPVIIPDFRKIAEEEELSRRREIRTRDSVKHRLGQLS